MREGRHKLGRLSLLCVSVVAAAGGISAQDGTGRSENVIRPANPASNRKTHRPPVRAFVAPEPVRRVELGKLALTVNEGESRVEITRLDAAASPDVITVPSRTSSLILRTLAAGNYRIVVSKYGYTDETREVEITDGKQQRIAVYLKTKMAFLSIRASAPGSRIEIEKVGTYNSPVNRLLLKPGRYTVTVTRRGYVPQTSNVELKAAGREENLQVVLKPLRVDELLEEANDNIAKGNYDAAREIAGDVLRLNPAHARANMIFATVELRRRGPEATSYFLRAIRSGETFRTKVKIHDPRSSKLLDAELSVDRDGVSVKSDARFDLDFTIARADINALNHFPNPAPGFLVLAGKSTFHGRSIEPNLRIHPHDVVADSSSNTTGCAAANCGLEFGELVRLLQAWRSEKSASK